MLPKEDLPKHTLGADDIGLATTQSIDATDQAERVIGPYHLVRRIGEGGMGEVWLAEQKDPVRRRVALKLIRGGLSTRETMARFDSERQALALMEHPAIAKVFDAGATPQGAPYFVMEYVAGVAITDYCDNHRLNTLERLELFTQVCEGVQHAHQKAIIHRDLKPSNILVTEVDGQAAPKIIDFGVAKALTQKLTGDTMFTRTGGLVGTPGYISPEQAASSGEDIDTRTDVYSLGVIFYQLLAGAPPIDLREVALEEFLRKLREDQPPGPSTKISTHDRETSTDVANKRQTEPLALARQLRGDLDSIALKALEKERSRRYASASEFAADIRRYLNHEPVLAVPPSLAYRSRKFARRHRAALATALAFALVLIVASIVSIRQSVRANREAAASRRVTDFMTKMFKVSDPGEARGNSITAREILDKASKEIDTGLSNDPQLQAQMMNVMGTVYENLGLYSQAEPLLRRALETRRHTLGDRNKDTLQSMYDLAELLTWKGRPAEAEKLCRESLEGRKAVLGAEHRDTLASMTWLAWILFTEGRYPEAEKMYREAIAIATRALKPEDNVTLRARNRLGVVLAGEGKYREAETIFREVLETDRRTLGPESLDTLESTSNLANVLQGEGKFVEAENLNRDTLPVYQRVYGPEHRKTLMVEENLGNCLTDEGRYAEAEKLERDALEIERRKFGPDNRSTLITMGNLAEALTGEGQYSEAEELLRQAVNGKRRTLGPEHPSIFYSLESLGNVLEKEKRYPEAETVYRQAFDGRNRVLGAANPDTADSAYGLACVLALENRRDEAFTNLQFAVQHALRADKREGLQTDPGLNSLHGDPRFNALLAAARPPAPTTPK
jgi:eukaryotic-like serine/threonine-protein kinase